MAKKKAAQSSRQNGTTSTSSSSNVKLSLLIPGVVGVLLAAIASFMFVGSGKAGVPDNENSPAVTPTTTAVAAETSSSSSSYSSTGRKLIVPEAGSWTDGYYTTEEVSAPAATHALLYPNGGGSGGDEPELAAFRNEEEFLALGRLYNDLGQIVQSPSHLVNGTVLYRGPTSAGRHFQWPAVRVGYKRPVPGLVGGTGKPVELETLTEPIDGAEPESVLRAQLSKSGRSRGLCGI